MSTALWILAGGIFSILTITLAMVSLPYFKKDTSEKMWKVYGMRTRYWQVVVLVGALLTMLLMYGLKWMNLISF
ncbi:MAG: hypothetical protein KDD41_08680 [Flavobacteriales bacterium]|nr:hypothetical protein [Flavobacteriales bacterium]